MPQLNETLADIMISTIFIQLGSEDMTTVLDYNDDGLVAYHYIAQLM